MRAIICSFSLFVCSLFSQEIELFMDWNCEAKGQELFPLDGTSMPSLIRKKLQQKGWEIRSWEKERYFSVLMSWKQVHSWKDLKTWIRSWGAKPLHGQTKWVFWSLGPKIRDYDFSRGEKEKMVLFMWEPAVVQPESHDRKMHAHFGKIFTWDDDLVDGVRYFKFHYPVWKPRIEAVVPFAEKKFCTLINSRLSSKHPLELYSERERVIRFYEDKVGEFDLYGRFWEKRKYKNYRGVIGDKMGVLKNYRFAICYENTRDVKGYITEKIFDCFAAGVVPVYWGASNVYDYIPRGCFVDRRDFQDDGAVYTFLKEMGEEEYGKYVEQGALFLQSEKAQLFTEAHFVDTFMDIIK